MLKFWISLCVTLLIAINVDAFANRDTSRVSSTAIDSIKMNMDHFRNCIDKSLATAVDEVNEKQIQPLLSVVGEQLNRISKAFEDLTASSTPKPE